MRQHRSFCKSSRPACILQYGQFIARGLHGQVENLYPIPGLQLQHRAHRVQGLILEALLSAQARFWMPGIALAEGIKGMEHWRKKIGRTRENNMFQLRIGTYRMYNGIEVIKHDEDTSARICHLVLHLALSI